MRRAFFLLGTLTLASLNACGLFTGPELTIQLQGTVTAADDGSPIAGASVRVRGTCLFSCAPPTFGLTTTDESGRYSLSFDRKGRCNDSTFFLEVRAEGFRFQGFFSSVTDAHDPHVTCTEELQTIDAQLEREPT